MSEVIFQALLAVVKALTIILSSAYCGFFGLAKERLAGKDWD